MFQLTIGDKAPDPVYLGQEATWILAVLVQLAWPIVAVIALILLRDPLRRFIDRIRHVEGPAGTSADTEKAIEKAERNTAEAANSDEDRDKRPDDTGPGGIEPIAGGPRDEGPNPGEAKHSEHGHTDEARSNIEAYNAFLAGGFSAIDIIVRSWSILEIEIFQCALRYKLNDRSPSRLIAMLSRAGILKPTQTKALQSLRSVRNAIVHKPFETSISLDQAQRFAKSAAELVEQIRNLRPGTITFSTSMPPSSLDDD